MDSPCHNGSKRLLFLQVARHRSVADTMRSVARWSLPSLNYRRGIQRIYLVLSVLWIATIATISTSERPIPSQKPVCRDDHGNPIPCFDEFVKSRHLTDAPDAHPLWKELERSDDWK